MQREILFRGKRQDNAEWVESPGLLVHKDGTVIMAFSADDDQITTGPVFSESIGQYTGLKDKNGVRIFEGDIVESDGSMSFNNYDSGKGSRREIHSWRTGFVGVRLGNDFDISNESSAHIWSNYQLWNISKSLEVKGNIHDNPELQNQTT